MLRNPKQFTCAYCGKLNETRRGGKLPIFCDRKCRGLSRHRRIDNPVRYTDALGYVRTEYWSDELKKRVHEFEHRRVWREAGRAVPDGFVLHHVNENKSDNRLENLELMQRGEHGRHHHRDEEKYPETPARADYNRRWREQHPEHKLAHAARERARRASKRGGQMAS